MSARKSQRSGGQTSALAVLAEGTGFLLRRASLAVYGTYMAELGSLGVRPAEYAALIVIHGNPGARSADISALLAIEKANFTGFLRRLERRGWVRREPSTTDGRAHALYLTPIGRDVLDAVGTRRRVQEAELAARLGALDHARLVELLQTLLATGDDAPPATPERVRPASRPGPDRAG